MMTDNIPSTPLSTPAKPSSKPAIIAIVQARMGSTRLPGKVLKSVLSKPMITHQLERISRSKHIDNIIVAISDNPKDDILQKYLLQGDYNIFRGDENDVLRRFYGVIEAYGIPDEAMIIRLTADCPLIDWRLIDELIEHFCRLEVDYLSNAFPRVYPDGMDAEIFRAKALKIAHQNATTPYEREHTTPYIRHSERFKKGTLPQPPLYPQWRLTLDTPQDEQRIRAIFEHFGNNDFSLQDIIPYFKAKPQKLIKNIKYEKF